MNKSLKKQLSILLGIIIALPLSLTGRGGGGGGGSHGGGGHGGGHGGGSHGGGGHGGYGHGGGGHGGYGHGGYGHGGYGHGGYGHGYGYGHGGYGRGGWGWGHRYGWNAGWGLGFGLIGWDLYPYSWYLGVPVSWWRNNYPDGLDTNNTVIINNAVDKAREEGVYNQEEDDSQDS